MSLIVKKLNWFLENGVGQAQATAVVASDNRYIDITLPEVLWQDVDNEIELTYNTSVLVSFAANGGTCASITTKGIKQPGFDYFIASSNLVGGTDTFRVFLVPSGPASGPEIVTVDVSGYDESEQLKEYSVEIELNTGLVSYMNISSKVAVWNIIQDMIEMEDTQTSARMVTLFDEIDVNDFAQASLTARPTFVAPDLTFDGSNDALNNVSQFQSIFRGSWTMSFHVKHTDGQGANQIYFRQLNSGNNHRVQIYKSTTGTIITQFTSTGGDCFAQTANVIFPNGATVYFKITIVMDITSGYKIYVDDVLQSLNPANNGLLGAVNPLVYTPNAVLAISQSSLVNGSFKEKILFYSKALS